MQDRFRRTRQALGFELGPQAFGAGFTPFHLPISLRRTKCRELALTRAFSGEGHKRGLPLVVLSFCRITRTFTNGAARGFRRSLIGKPVYPREAARQGCGEFLAAVAGSCLDEHLAPCRSGTKFLMNRYVR